MAPRPHRVCTHKRWFGHRFATPCCEKRLGADGPVAHIVAEAIRQRNVPRADLVSILHSEGLAEISPMERRLSVLALIAQVAPVLGLLGTVLALLKTVLQAEANAPLTLRCAAPLNP